MSEQRVMTDLERIGEGRTAEIFAWDEGRVLRLYRAGSSREWVLRELHAFAAVHEAGIPCPAVHPEATNDGLVELDGRIGFVMDRIDGPSMLSLLSAKPWRIRQYARLLAGLHAAIHRCKGVGLPNQRERFHLVLDHVEGDLGVEPVRRIRASLDAMPDDDAVCHGDFHPDNVLMPGSGPIVIDWGPASSGQPAADVAWTVLLFRHGGVPTGTKRWIRLLLALTRRAFLASYRRELRRQSDIRWQEVRAWAPIIAAIRLGDGIPEEREPLLRLLRHHFG